MVNDLEFRKVGYSTQANVASSKHLDEILSNAGEVSIRPNREKLFKIINPHVHDIKDLATVMIEHWESVDGTYIDEENIDRLVAVDEATGEKILTQSLKTARATEVKIWIELKAKESKLVKVILEPREDMLYDLSLIKGAEGIKDIATDNRFVSNEYKIENDFFSIEFDNLNGISKLLLKEKNISILDEKAVYAPFSGIYEVTPIRSNPVEERRVMGRNRKGKFAKRFSSKLKDIQIINDGDIFTSVLLDYELEGTKIYSIYLKIFKVNSRIDATIRIHKTSNWEPENVYVALPFTLPESEKYIDKSGCLIRPGIDQLPGTNLEFYLSQNGIVHKSNNGSLFVMCNDAPLLTFGNLNAHEIQLADSNSEWKNKETTYSWIMNNYWETNFKVDLGGFYEFNYSLSYNHDNLKEDEISSQLKYLAQGVIGIPV